MWIGFTYLSLGDDVKTSWLEVIDILRRRGAISHFQFKGWTIDEIHEAMKPLVDDGQVELSAPRWAGGEPACLLWRQTQPKCLTDLQMLSFNHQKFLLEERAMRQGTDQEGILMCRVDPGKPLGKINLWYPKGLPMYGLVSISGNPAWVLSPQAVEAWGSRQWVDFGDWMSQDEIPFLIYAAHLSSGDVVIPEPWVQWRMYLSMIPDEQPDFVTGIQPLDSTDQDNCRYLDEGYHYRAWVQNLDSDSEFNLTQKLEQAGFREFLLPPGIE